MRRRYLLTLDIATTTGFAHGYVGDAPSIGSFRVSPEGSTAGYTFVRFFDWIDAFIAEHHPYAVCYEEPITTFGNTNRSTTEVLRGMIAVTEERATRRAVPFIAMVNISDWRKFMFGKGAIKRGTPSKKIKRMTVEKCRDMGFDPPDDNAADALAIWLYMQAFFNEQDARRAGSGK